MSIRCPNCNQEVDYRPIHCPRCGYRSELAAEYFWLYIAGGLITLAGLAFGASSFLVTDAPPEHWSRRFLGWFPLGPWPSTYHWLAFLVEGIIWTLIGLGITRHRRGALALLVALVLWEMIWTGRKLLTGAPGESMPVTSSLLITAEILGLLLASRLFRALRRTPPRDVSRLQNPSV